MLKGKTAVVTGSTSGIGLAIARALAAQGANTVINGFGDKSAIEKERAGIESEFSVKSVYSPADMTKPAEIADMIKAAEQTFGAVDILVNNAGIIRRAPAAEYSAANWDEVIATNMTSVFHLSQVAGRQMLNQGRGGKIVSIASVLSFQGGIYVPAYAAAKGGLAQLTRAFANEWAVYGINVNAIAPGYMTTDNTAALRNDVARNKAIVDRIPAGRWGDPQELGGAAVFLCSAASSYVHGHVLLVDGGWLGR